MAFELRDGQGNFFKNRRKTSEKQPDWKGKVKTPDGKEWELAGWIRDSKDGGKWFSLKISEPRQGGSGYRREPGDETDID